MAVKGKPAVCWVGNTVGRLLWPSWFGGVARGGRREIREGEVNLVLIPLLIAPIFVAIVVFVIVDHV